MKHFAFFLLIFLTSCYTKKTITSEISYKDTIINVQLPKIDIVKSTPIDVLKKKPLIITNKLTVVEVVYDTITNNIDVSVQNANDSLEIKTQIKEVYVEKIIEKRSLYWVKYIPIFIVVGFLLFWFVRK